MVAISPVILFLKYRIGIILNNMKQITTKPQAIEDKMLHTVGKTALYFIVDHMVDVIQYHSPPGMALLCDGKTYFIISILSLLKFRVQTSLFPLPSSSVPSARIKHFPLLKNQLWFWSKPS